VSYNRGMPFSAGRHCAGVLLVASLFFACGGRSENLEADEGSAGDATGATGGNGTGGAGTSGASSGGSITIGGTSSGGAASGGTGAAGGVLGTGGAGGSAECGDCPLADYGLVIEGDGAPYGMHYNGMIDAAESEERPRDPNVCPVEVLRGTVGGCSRSITLFACEDPGNGRPCLEVTGRTARYVDRATGMLWEGTVLSDLAGAYESGIESGTLELEFASGSAELHLTVKYTFCTTGVMLDIVCAPP
jgi:hypothetical protein